MTIQYLSIKSNTEKMRMRPIPKANKTGEKKNTRRNFNASANRISENCLVRKLYHLLNNYSIDSINHDVNRVIALYLNKFWLLESVSLSLSVHLFFFRYIFRAAH